MSFNERIMIKSNDDDIKTAIEHINDLSALRREENIIVLKPKTPKRKLNEITGRIEHVSSKQRCVDSNDDLRMAIEHINDLTSLCDQENIVLQPGTFT